MYKILIADGAEEFGLALVETIRGKYQIQVCRDGQSAWKMLHDFAPDVLVLDLLLPGLDGISLLQMAHEEGMCPLTLATTRLINEYVMESVEKYRVGYLMVKPCNLKAVALRLSDLTNSLSENTDVRLDPKRKIYHALLELGFPTKLKGYTYICEAALIMSRDFSQSVTKEIYPVIAKNVAGSAQQVERAIRNAIACAWNKRNVRRWSRYFQPDTRGDVPKPTNAELITRLAHIIHCE